MGATVIRKHISYLVQARHQQAADPASGRALSSKKEQSGKAFSTYASWR
jgi:hypothetical protein